MSSTAADLKVPKYYELLLQATMYICVYNTMNNNINDNDNNKECSKGGWEYMNIYIRVKMRFI